MRSPDGGPATGPILVTGATGVIGRLIVATLLEGGYRVRALVRPHPGAAAPLRGPEQILGPGRSHPHLTLYEGSLEEPESLLAALDGCAGCVHAAGLVTFSNQDLAALLQANVTGTAHVANACLELADGGGAAPVLVHLSSVAALADPAADPRTTPEMGQFSSVYGYSKHLAELECHRAGAEGLPYALLRPAVILAPHPDGRSSASLLAAARRPWAAAPPVHLHYIDGRDVAEAALKALEQLLRRPDDSPLDEGPNGGGPIYLLAAGGISMRPFIERYRQRLGITDGGIVDIPLWLARFGGRLRALVRPFYRGPLPSAKQMQAMSRPRDYGSTATTEALLGRPLRPLDETLDWLVSQERADS